ncbi:MAG: hypothetical protein HRJ53_27230, partial [Acidobacteria bacterium Pan2503]|nr:hypothetical protein [Candidatus Acidoferrum panamensis]
MSKRKHALPPRMKVSDWLKDRVGSHDICNYRLVCKDFRELTGVEPTWGSYPVATAKRMIERRGVGGYVNGPDDEEVIG